MGMLVFLCYTVPIKISKNYKYIREHLYMYSTSSGKPSNLLKITLLSEVILRILLPTRHIPGYAQNHSCFLF